ncbi:MAG TPA: DUF5808 domain-containing protein [Ktedonobacterales bacterium]
MIRMTVSALVPWLIGAVALALALVLFLPSLRSRQQAGSPVTRSSGVQIDRDEDRYWLAGVFYYNPDDPDPFVPKRYGLGWTINFAHPAGKVMLVVMIGMILLPVALAIFAPGLSGNGCHPGSCHLLP